VKRMSISERKSLTTMQFPGLFKRGLSISLGLRRPSSKKNNRETFYAVSASLAIHIGLALILMTATTMSASVKLGEVSIIHVSLVSMDAEGVSSASSLSKAEPKKAAKVRKEIVETAAVLKPVDKRNKQESVMALAPINAVGAQTVSAPATQAPQRFSSGAGDALTSQHRIKGQGGSIISNNPSPGEISVAVPRYRENAHPAYPLIARIRGYEGMVILTAEIFTDGSVGGLKIKESSGYAVLDKSAFNAVKNWKFEPGRKIGKPTTMWVDVPVKFLLKDAEDL